MPTASMLSLISTGRPWSGPRGFPAARSASSRSASASACGFSSITALSAGPPWSTAAMRARYASVSARAVSVPAVIRSRASAALSSTTSTAGAAAAAGVEGDGADAHAASRARTARTAVRDKRSIIGGGSPEVARLSPTAPARGQATRMEAGCVPSAILHARAFRPASHSRRRPSDDGVRLGAAPPLPTVARRRGASLPHRGRHRSARPLPLAAGADARAHRHPAARPRRVERRPLHVRPRRQGVGPRLQRRAPQPAQLRRHRAPDARALPLGTHRRSARGDAGAGRRRTAAIRLRRLLAGRQPGPEAGRRARGRRPRPRRRRRRGVGADRAGRLRRGARTPPQPRLSLELHARPAGADAAEGAALSRGLGYRAAAAHPYRAGLRRRLHRAVSRVCRRCRLLPSGQRPAGDRSAGRAGACSSPPTTTRSCPRRWRATRCWKT